MQDQRQIALKYLETIQRKGLENRYGKDYIKDFLKLKKKHADFPWDELLKQSKIPNSELKEIKAQYESDLKSTILHTKFELPLSFSILAPLYETIQNTAVRLGLNANSKVFIGTSQSKSYNAHAVKVPNTDIYLTIIESEIFNLSNLLAKIVVSCLPNFQFAKRKISFAIDKESIKNQIKKDLLLQHRFEDFVQNGIINSQPGKTLLYFLEDNLSKLHLELSNSVDLFIIAHEYAHICRGHLEKGKTTESKHDIGKIQLNWELEYEADALGLYLLVHSQEENILFSFLGPELFFSFLDLADRVNSFVKTGEERRPIDNESHPPNDERKRRIRAILKKAIPLTDIEMHQQISIFIENILEELWENYKSKLSYNNPEP